MKAILAAAALALSVFATNAVADEAPAPEVIVIYAEDMADAQRQIESAQRDVGSSVIIYLTGEAGPGTENAQRDVGSSVIII